MITKGTFFYNLKAFVSLVLSDGWPSYPEILANPYSHEEPVPYSGRGRPRKPIRIIDENLKYAEVVKHKEGSHLIEIEKRVIWETEEEILEIIRQEGEVRRSIRVRWKAVLITIAKLISV